MIYYVIETQTTNGTGAVGFSAAYTDEQDAYAKYHELLSVAEKSPVDYHGVFIVDENLAIPAYELARRISYPAGDPVWFVLEFQSGETGSVIPLTYTDKPSAWQQFYGILQFAAKSSIPKHGAILIRQDLEIYHETLAERSEQE